MSSDPDPDLRIRYATGAGSPPRSRDDKLKIMLHEYGLPQERFVHFSHLVAAQGIYSQRYAKYQDLPIHAMGAKGAIHEARVCVMRAWMSIWIKEFMADGEDLLDAVNYCVHALREAQAGNYNGEAWFPPNPAADQ